MEELNGVPTAFQRRSAPSLRTPVWLWGILAGAAIAFVGGFYLPEQSANAVLTAHLERLSAEYQSAITAYEKKTAALTAAEKIRDEQKGKLGAISEAESKKEKAISELHGQIEGSLEKFVKNKVLTVERTDESVAISLQSHFLVYPHKTFVHAPGKRLLCEIAKSIPKQTAQPTQIVAHANGESPWSGILKKQLPSSFQLSGTIASEVTLELANCGIEGENLRAVGAGHFGGDATLAKKSPVRLEFLVYPKDSSS